MKKQNAKSRNSVIKSRGKKKGVTVRRKNKPSKNDKAKIDKPPVKRKAVPKQVRATKKTVQLINKNKNEKPKRKQNGIKKASGAGKKTSISRSKVNLSKQKFTEKGIIKIQSKKSLPKKSGRTVNAKKATNEQILKLLAKVISDNKKFKASLKKKDAEIVKLKKRGTSKRPANIQARYTATDGKNKALGDKAIKRERVTFKKFESSFNAYFEREDAKRKNAGAGRFIDVSDKNTNGQGKKTIKPVQKKTVKKSVKKVAKKLPAKKTVKKQEQKRQTKKEQSEVELLRYQRNYQKSKVRSLMKLIEYHRELQAKDGKLKVSFEGKDNVPNTFVIYTLNQRISTINNIVDKINSGIRHYGGKVVLGKKFAPISIIATKEFTENNIITIAAGKHYDLDRMYGFLKYLKLNTFEGYNLDTHSEKVTQIFNEVKTVMASKHIYWLIWRADLSESWGYIDAGPDNVDFHSKLPLGMKYTDLQLLSVNKQEEIKDEANLPLGLRYSYLSDKVDTKDRKAFLQEGLKIVDKNNPNK